MQLCSFTHKVTCLLFLFGVLATTAVAKEPAQPGQPTRVIMGIGAADKILSALEYCVVDLAGKKTSYENDIKPNLEIFLYGVSTDQPIRFDTLFDKKNGLQLQATIPISNLKEFIDDNLDPIGIVAKQERSDKTLYKLSGEVYEGWFRYLAKPVPYAAFFPQKDGLPKDMVHPVTRHQELVEKNYIAFLSQSNEADGVEDRRAAFDKYVSTEMEKFQKLTTETKEQFALRKRLREQLLNLIGQWFSELAEVRAGATVNKDKGDAPSDIMVSAIPGTGLEANLKKLRETPSLFSAIEAPESAILSGRIRLLSDDKRKKDLREIYALAREVVPQRIDDDTTSTEEERTARKEIANHLIDVLDEGVDAVGGVDAFIDISSVKKAHTLIAGVASTNPEKLVKFLEKLPAAKAGWKMETAVEKVGEAQIHKLSFGNAPPKSLTNFYGTSGVIYFATAPKTFWIATGEESLPQLKSHLELAAKPLPEKGNGVLLTVKMKALPVLQHIQEMKNDPELEVLKQIDLRTRKQKEAVTDGKKSESKGRGGSRAAELASLEWHETAIAAMAGTDDSFESSIIVNEEFVLHGHSNAHQGILKAFGAVVSKFADENLK